MPSNHALIAARKAVEINRPLEAMQHLDEFRAGFGTHRISGDEAELIESELNRIRILAEAALQGMSRARDLIRQMSEMAHGCRVYDREGKRQTHRVHPTNTRRF